jgi:hypothetical protein
MSEELAPEDAHIVVLRSRGVTVFKSMFPFIDFPSDLEGKFIPFWKLVSVCLAAFDRCRRRIWAVIRAACALSDCPDLDHITYEQFCSFIAVTFSNFAPKDAKTLWNDLSVRNVATGKPGDLLDFSALAFLVTEAEEMLFAVISVRISQSFNQQFGDLNGSMRMALRYMYIVGRLVHSVPVVAKEIPDALGMMETSRIAIRTCLFQCDVSEAPTRGPGALSSDVVFV